MTLLNGGLTVALLYPVTVPTAVLHGRPAKIPAGLQFAAEVDVLADRVLVRVPMRDFKDYANHSQSHRRGR